MNPTMKVECPRCHRIWEVMQGTPDMDCNCHLYCDMGQKPGDCTLISATSSSAPDYWRGDWGWPAGLHNNAAAGVDDIFSRISYCTTHARFTDKKPVIIECNWDWWQTRRAPSRMRHGLGRY